MRNQMFTTVNHAAFSAIGFVACLAAPASAEWPQFRGPAGNNVATAGSPPLEWDEGTNVVWSVDMPGEGWSSPIVAGSRVFLTSASPVGAEAFRFEVHCFDLATGDKRWTRLATEAVPRMPIHRDNSRATETPVTDGEQVIAYFGMTGCYAFNLQGEPLWQKDLGAYRIANAWGASSSPTIADGLVYLQIDNEEQSHIVALDTSTGNQRWRVERPEEKTNWCSPIVWRNSQRTELVTGGKTVSSYEAASGKLLWSMPIGGRSSATATAVGDTLFIGSEDRSHRDGTPGGLFAVKAGATGELDAFSADAPSASLLWANLRGSIGISSPLVYNGLIYAPARGAGVVSVHDATTGDVIRKDRIRGAAKFWASPWAAAGRVLMMDERGVTFVLEPGAELKVLARNRLPGRFWSSPAVAGDTLIVRSQDRLFAIRQSR